jgi:hypothetical protein
MLSGRLLTIFRDPGKEEVRQQVSPKIGNSVPHYSVVHPREDSSYEESHLIY